MLSLVLLDVDIGSTAKNAKMSNRRLLLVPELKWSLARCNGRSGRPVVHMSECSNCIPPERARELGFIKHANNRLHKHPVEVSALALKDSVGLVHFSFLFVCFIHSLHLHCVHLIQLSLYHFHVTVGISYYLRHVLYSRGALLIARALC